ncbi:hypothetical protein JCM10207_000830 [Rhodosporidiobolus poonsookiae]
MADSQKTLPTLPAELWAAVSAYAVPPLTFESAAARADTLARTSCVCKATLEAQDALYERVLFTAAEQLDRFIQTLQNPEIDEQRRAELAAKVRHVGVEPRDKDRWASYDLKTLGELCPRIETLVLNCVKGSSAELFKAYKALRTLHLFDCQFEEPEFFDFSHFAIPTLRQLSLHDAGFNSYIYSNSLGNRYDRPSCRPCRMSTQISPLVSAFSVRLNAQTDYRNDCAFGHRVAPTLRSLALDELPSAVRPPSERTRPFVPPFLPIRPPPRYQPNAEALRALPLALLSLPASALDKLPSADEAISRLALIPPSLRILRITAHDLPVRALQPSRPLFLWQQRGSPSPEPEVPPPSALEYLAAFLACTSPLDADQRLPILARLILPHSLRATAPPETLDALTAFAHARSAVLEWESPSAALQLGLEGVHDPYFWARWRKRCSARKRRGMILGWRCFASA